MNLKQNYSSDVKKNALKLGIVGKKVFKIVMLLLINSRVVC